MNTELEDNIQSALASNPALRDKILFLVAERDAYWKEQIEELELSCVDDRLLGRTDEYLDGYNTSTERWREQRDALLDNLK